MFNVVKYNTYRHVNSMMSLMFLLDKFTYQNNKFHFDIASQVRQIYWYKVQH